MYVARPLVVDWLIMRAAICLVLCVAYNIL
jgi:hypothetical protein